MNKKLLALGVVGTLGMAGVVAVPLIVSADDNVATQASTTVSTFVQKLAAQLGLDQTTVQNAVSTVQSDLKTERETQAKADIAQAVTDGTLTQRQADILTALQGVQLGSPSESNKPDMSNWSTMTQEERQSQMEANRTAREQELVTKLNESGLNTTTEELQTTEEAARTAGLRIGGRGFGMGGGPGGHGGEMGMGMF